MPIAAFSSGVPIQFPYTLQRCEKRFPLLRVLEEGALVRIKPLANFSL
jgi:hypothetical protein